MHSDDQFVEKILLDILVLKLRYENIGRDIDDIKSEKQDGNTIEYLKLKHFECEDIINGIIYNFIMAQKYTQLVIESISTNWFLRLWYVDRIAKLNQFIKFTRSEISKFENERGKHWEFKYTLNIRQSSNKL